LISGYFAAVFDDFHSTAFNLDTPDEGGKFVDVEITIGKVGNSSFDMLFTISDEGTVLAKVKTVQVAVNVETMKSRPLTDKEREFLSKYLETN
jgi:acyl-CoA thioester hydrolase